MNRILIIDDDIAVCESLKYAFQKKYALSIAHNPSCALKEVVENHVDIVLLDLKLGNYDGMNLFYELKSIDTNVVVIIMTAYGTIRSSIDAVKKGVFNYITKPIDLDEIEFMIEKGLEFRGLINQINDLSEQLKKKSESDGIVSKSKAMLKVMETVKKVKNIDTNILITGESGTGKELIAKAIHFQGRRKDKNFIAINCSAIPGNLLESELFGHETGAYTGAHKSKKGLFELAHEGTLFLDEVGEMDILLQSKLLRAIQEKEITPVGSTVNRSIDVRIIAATNRSLEESINEGTFRKDLFYRLNVINIHLPTLKERKEDIPFFIEFFLKKYNTELSKSIKGVTVDFLSCLQNYDFKGNVRELENLIERAVALSEKDYLDEFDLPISARKVYRSIEGNDDLIPVFVGEKMKDIEKRVILRTLEKFDFKVNKTAETLGLSDKTISNKMKQYKEGKKLD